MERSVMNVSYMEVSISTFKNLMCVQISWSCFWHADSSSVGLVWAFDSAFKSSPQVLPLWATPFRKEAFSFTKFSTWKDNAIHLVVAVFTPPRENLLRTKAKWMKEELRDGEKDISNHIVFLPSSSHIWGLLTPLNLGVSEPAHLFLLKLNWLSFLDEGRTDLLPLLHPIFSHQIKVSASLLAFHSPLLSNIKALKGQPHSFPRC